MNATDKKINEYLERARAFFKINGKKEKIINEDSIALESLYVEVAKMIQLEELRGK